MSKQVLSIEQMKHLQELGVNTGEASACWHRVLRMNTNQLVKDWFASFNKTQPCLATMKVETLPTFTLQDILDLLPHRIKGNCFLFIIKDKYAFRDVLCYKVRYNDVWRNLILVEKKEYELIDALYEMLCWCIENGYI